MMTQTTSCREMMNHSTIHVLLGSSKELIEKNSSIILASDNVHNTLKYCSEVDSRLFPFGGTSFGKIAEA